MWSQSTSPWYYVDLLIAIGCFVQPASSARDLLNFLLLSSCLGGATGILKAFSKYVNCCSGRKSSNIVNEEISVKGV